MVNIKTASEIERMRAVGALAAEQLEMIADHIKPVSYTHLTLPTIYSV